VRQTARRLEAEGFSDYRRTDPLALRLLQSGPRSISELASFFGISRQAARKAVDSLKGRGYARERRDPNDTRRVEVALTPEGAAYAVAVLSTIAELDRELAGRIPPDLLAAADTVLRAAIVDESARQRAERLISPPGGRAADEEQPGGSLG
jgi:DNA-binding MarR family transcriptional regulator